MKGIIFTEFLDLVEEKFGLAMVDKIIQQSKLASKGIYTSIGTYSFSEMLQLLQHLSANTKISIDDLLLVYGEHLFLVLGNSREWVQKNLCILQSDISVRPFSFLLGFCWRILQEEVACYSQKIKLNLHYKFSITYEPEGIPHIHQFYCCIGRFPIWF